MRVGSTLLCAVAFALPYVRALSEADSIDAFTNFLDHYLSPHNAQVAASINSTLFAEDVKGSVDREFHHMRADGIDADTSQFRQSMCYLKQNGSKGIGGKLGDLEALGPVVEFPQPCLSGLAVSMYIILT